jgi:serine-type anaerobic sulfatase-maturating enzyme
MMLSPNVTLIVKLTNACDMKCRYCFIEPSVYHKKMKLATAQRVVRAFLESDYFETVHFVWHGGEPLLRGPQFFQRIFDEQRACATRVTYSNSTQTNATHLGDDVLDLLLANDVSIGLSLDGPASLNDLSRTARRVRPRATDGREEPRGAHATTIDAARRLQERGREAGAIVTVSRNNVSHPEAIYEEFRSRRINMKVNPLTRSGLADTPLGADLGITAAEYGRFLVRLFDAWFDDPEPTISVEPLAQHVARILGLEVAHSCFYTLSCHHFFLGISPDGDLFPCGMFQGEPSFRYGNVHDMDPEQVAQTVLFGRIEEREKKVLQDCARCAFLDLCYSGCMFHSLKDSKVLAQKDYYCEGYKMYFEHALRRVHGNLISALERNPRPAAPDGQANPARRPARWAAKPA